MRTILLLGMFWALAAPAAPSCANRSVTVVALREKAEAIRNLFLMMNHLPFEVNYSAGDSKLVAITITYRRLTASDQFQEPSSFELAEQVRSALASHLKEYGVESLEARYDPKLNC